MVSDFLAEEKAEGLWQKLADHASEWFYRPDLDALRIALATAVSHYSVEDDPVWLYVIGVPGSGKTSITIECLSVFPKSRILSDISVPALISGMSKPGKCAGYGLLFEVGSSALFFFKDFTTILTMRRDERDRVLGALREIYDGRYSRQFGTSKHTESKWEGKITVIAAVTPAIESMWGFNNKMGDRFVQIRLPRIDGVKTAEFARKQIGHKKEIKEGLHKLTRELIEHRNLALTPVISPLLTEQMDTLAEVVATLRCHVDRDQKDRIMFAGQPEMPTRLIQGFTQIARAHASLFHRDINEQDVHLARRVAIDTIPMSRLRIFQSIPNQASITRAEIIKLTGLARSTVTYIADELHALNVLKVEKEEDSLSYSFTGYFQDLKYKAGLHAYGLPVVAPAEESLFVQ